MPKLADSTKYMQELTDHIISREGVIDYFYCDNEGLVTIGIGHLVDSRNAVQGEVEAAKFARENYMSFKTTKGMLVANMQDVVADWRLVKEYGKLNPAIRSGAFKTVAQLRISRDGIKQLLQKKLTDFANTLISKRPFAAYLDEQIQMALIDARYNPAGIKIYGDAPPDLPRMWDALNKDKSTFDLMQAIKLFRNIWKGRGGKNAERYQSRHMLRVAMFARGIQKQLGPSTPPIDINLL